MTTSNDSLGLKSKGLAGVTKASTPLGSAAVRRPHMKALALAATATPLSSIAPSNACADKGSKPFCQAKPSMNKLVAMASPHKAVAKRVAST